MMDKDKNTGYLAVCHGDDIISESIATNSRDAIIRFFMTDGMGKYIDLGWHQAVKDGYYLVYVMVVL